MIRRKVFIKKRFQADFAVKFLVLIALEAVLAIGLFVYLSRGTLITGFTGSEVVVARTDEYFLPTLLLTNLVVIGVTALVGFVVLLLVSHKIAGPLWRFERSLEELEGGNLEHRFNLRSRDQMHELAARMNEVCGVMDDKVSEIQARVRTLDSVLQGADVSEAARKELEGLKEAAGYFRTSEKDRESAGGGGGAEVAD